MLSWLLKNRKKKENKAEKKPVKSKKTETTKPRRKRAVVLGIDGSGAKRGIYKRDRMHMAVFGFPGTGKSTFLLNLIKQNIDGDEGFLIMDPHGDLIRKAITHVPKEKWDRVVYISPLTAYDMRFKSVVQINFLQYEEKLDRDLVARTIMDALQKIYQRFWGPRLDMIMLNALYLLLEGSSPEQPKFTEIYNVLSSEEYREMLLGKCGDEKVVTFWESEFKKMPRDASAAVMTKIYRIVQEKVIAPMFDCERSSINFRRIMDEGLFVFVNLSEGRITSDLANFLGSLILAQIYLAAMSRESVPEKERRPFYVYVDEAYRFTTRSIQDILQSLRKYKVFMALVSQFLGQYDRETAQSIPSLCDTIICFSVGKETAKTLEEFYTPGLTYKDLMFLPRYHFAASVLLGNERLWQVLKCIDHGYGSSKFSEVVKHSLDRYGRPIDVELYIRSAEAVGKLYVPKIYPIEYVILSTLWKVRDEGSGKGPNNEWVEYDALYTADTFNMVHNFDSADFVKAMNLLVRRGYIGEHDEETRWKGIRVLYEPPLITQPVKCVKCGKLTQRPFRLKRSMDPLCRSCLERSLGDKSLTWSDVDGLTEDDLGGEFRAKRIIKYYYLRPAGMSIFTSEIPRGRRGGGTRHTAMLSYMIDKLRAEGKFCIVDVGREAPKRKEDGKYETKELPDITVYPFVREGQRTHPWRWNTPRRYAVEVETDPLDHKEHVIDNWKKCAAFGIPVIFTVDDEEVAVKTAKMLRDAGARIVSNVESEYGAGNVQVLYLHPETGTQFTVHPEMLDIEEAEVLVRKSSEKAEDKEEDLRSDKTVTALQPLTPASLMAFSDWKLKARKAKSAGLILLAEKTVNGNTVTVQIGKLDEKTKEMILKNGLEVEGLSEFIGTKSKIDGWQKSEETQKKIATKEGEKLPPKKKGDHKSSKERKMAKIEARLQQYRDWTLFIKRSQGRLYVYAMKYDSAIKKKRFRSIGPYDDAIEILKKHGISLQKKGL